MALPRVCARGCGTCCHGRLLRRMPHIQQWSSLLLGSRPDTGDLQIKGDFASVLEAAKRRLGTGAPGLCVTGCFMFSAHVLPGQAHPLLAMEERKMTVLDAAFPGIAVSGESLGQRCEKGSTDGSHSCSHSHRK